jgi:2-dehydro-3-deoxy-D-arabinonate dehydratase
MKLCRFADSAGQAHVGAVNQAGTLLDLTAAGAVDLTSLLEADDPAAEAARLAQSPKAKVLELARLRLLCPIERQEVWAAGVTYLRSKEARMDESDFGATAYDRVYTAARPELFFKSLPEKVVGPGEAIGVRADSQWTVPEPELALVFNSRGRLAGYSIGNDVSARDIEGDNLLYLPQAKIYTRSCAIGPWIEVGAEETQARTWQVGLVLDRQGETVFRGTVEVGRLRRSFGELGEWLFRCQHFPAGAVLLTGTGVVPPDDFTLEAGDRVTIRISGLGALENHVVEV